MSYNSLFLLFFRCRFFQIFLDPELDNRADQLVRYRFVERKLRRSFGRFVRRQLGLEFLSPAGRRVKTNVVLERSEMHQVAVQLECRHLVTDGFLGFRRGRFDRLSDFLQYLLDIGREAGDVIVNGPGAWLGRIQLYLL
jgi:hypothetical protein